MKHIKRIAVIFMSALTLSLVVPEAIPMVDNVTTAQAAVKISKKSYRMVKGATLHLNLTGTKKKAKWTTSKRSVANITQKGKVTAKNKGITTITAKIGKKKYTCKITVESPKMSRSKVTLNVGSSVSLKLNGTKQKVKWSSKNTSVATFSNGKVKGIKSGSTTIIAKVGGKSYSCKVNVNAAPNVTPPTKPDNKDMLIGSYTDTGDGTFTIYTASGNSQNGNVPINYISKNTFLSQIGAKTVDFDYNKTSYLYIDRYLHSKNHFGRSQMTLTLTGNNLNPGLHRIEVVQYENDSPDSKVITYKSGYYKISIN